jgi:hypothetical protein
MVENFYMDYNKNFIQDIVCGRKRGGVVRLSNFSFSLGNFENTIKLTEKPEQGVVCGPRNI